MNAYGAVFLNYRILEAREAQAQMMTSDSDFNELIDDLSAIPAQDSVDVPEPMSSE